MKKPAVDDTAPIIAIAAGLPAVPAGQSAAEKLYEAVSYINQAKAELDKLQGQYNPDQAAWGQCETIDDHLFEALRLLGQ